MRDKLRDNVGLRGQSERRQSEPMKKPIIDDFDDFDPSEEENEELKEEDLEELFFFGKEEGIFNEDLFPILG